MGILDGQAVSAAITNPAFINKNINDTMGNILGFNRPSSGSSIADIQAAVNRLYTASGASETQTGTVYNATPSTINNGDPYQTALFKLAEKFDPATGHKHTGTAGDAPLLGGSSIANVPLLQFIEQGTQITGATGNSTDVSSLLGGKLPSNNSTTLGVVVNMPNNRVFLTNAATGNNFTDELVDSSGNIIYGRISNTLGVWTINYFSLVSGIETPYSFPTATNIRWFYRELFAPLISTPDYEPIFELFYKTVKSIKAGTGGSPLYGDVTLSAGANILLSATGNTIQIESTGGAGGGGGSLQWIESLDAPTSAIGLTNNIEIYLYDAGIFQVLWTTIKVPASYAPGSPISLRTFVYSADSTGNLLFQTVSTLIRSGIDQFNSTTNQRTSTNSAITLGVGTINIPQLIVFDLTSTIGQINGVSVSPNDIITVQLTRGSDTAVSQGNAMVYASEVSFS